MLSDVEIARIEKRDPARGAMLRAFKAVGNPARAAARLGVHHQAVYQWRRCPKHRVAALARISGVPKHELRPDLHPA